MNELICSIGGMALTEDAEVIGEGETVSSVPCTPQIPLGLA